MKTELITTWKVKDILEGFQYNKYELEDWVKATEICSIIHRCAYSLENKVKRVNMFETILGFLRNNP